MADICDYICNLHEDAVNLHAVSSTATFDELSSYLRRKGLDVKPYHSSIRSVYALGLCNTDASLLALPWTELLESGMTELST